jgi:hypothetical protein
MDPSTFLGSIWVMRVKYLRKHCLDASGLTFGELVKFGEPKVVKQLDHKSIYICFLLTRKLKRLSRFLGRGFEQKSSNLCMVNLWRSTKNNRLLVVVSFLL